MEAGIAFVTDGSGNRADYRGFVAGVPTTAWAAGAIFLMGLTLIATTRDENAPAAAAAIPREAEGENRA